MEGMKIHGDAKDGWIIEMHNGETFHAVALMVKTEAEAVKAALQSWKDKFKADFDKAASKVKDTLPVTKDLPKTPDKTS